MVASLPHNTERAFLLRDKAYDFCKALISPPPRKDLIAEYFTPDNPRIIEHGPSWATPQLPFLGRRFSGVGECEEYFDLLSKTLKMCLDEDAFPGRGGFVVDAAAGAIVGTEENDIRSGVVSVVGKGRFESLRTGKVWEEQFIYRLSEFDDEGKIGHWEIWADPLSAWVAVGGESNTQGINESGG